MNGLAMKISAVMFEQEAPEPGVISSAHDAKQKVSANLINAGLIRRRLATGVFDLKAIDELLGQIMDNCYKASDILGEIQEMATVKV